MGGNMSFREALRVRLDIIRPSYETIEVLNRQQASKLTPGIKYNMIGILIQFSLIIFFSSLEI